jgi:hypothetical protein
MARAFGLPGMYSVKNSQTNHNVEVNGILYKITMTDSFWRGNFVGYRYWINDNKNKKYFCSRLKREEVIESAKKKIEKGVTHAEIN